MKVLHRVLFIGLVVGVVGATAAIGLGNPTISFTDCTKPSPTPTGSAPVSQPTLTPPPTSSPSTTSAPARTPGPDNCTPKSGSVVFGTQTLGFTVNPDGFQPIKNVKVEVKAYKDSGAADATGPLFNTTYTRCGRADTSFKVPWDTVNISPHNGHYEVVVTALAYSDPTCGGTGRSQQATRTDLLVDNAPDMVGPPRIIATTPSTISIQWDASTAPDVVRYSVYRAVTSSTKTAPSAGDFKLWGYTTEAAFRDSQVSPGVYWYAVDVTRRSVVTPDTGISAGIGPASAPVTIAAVPTSAPSGGSHNPIVAGPKRYIPLNPIILPPSRRSNGLAPVPDAPYSAQLPYGNTPEEGGAGTVSSGKNSGSGATDPRGPVLPVAVGAFLVSAALALGRMPY
jgi:hypothetical protein